MPSRKAWRNGVLTPPKPYNMKKIIPAAVILMMMTALSSCSAIAGIFKAGAVVGVIAVVVVIAIIIWIISMFRGKSS